MTDERMGDALWQALDRLPAGSGVVFRHFHTAPSQRRALFDRVLRIARRKRLLLVRAGDQRFRGEHGAHGVRNGRSGGVLTWPAHNRTEAIAGIRAGAALVFVSPVYQTRSHPGAATLGPLRAAHIARGLPCTVIALGGVNARRFRQLRALGFDGWAGIDAFSGGKTYQKRKAVPT